mgnify:CR=1 FL=1
MHVSPRHIASGHLDEWSLDDKIEVFIARVDGWHLEVADRCINGWQVDGQECIDAIDLKGNRTKHIPDSGWAVLQMVLNYFELIGFYKLEGIGARHREYFIAGVLDVFPRFREQNVNVPGLLWSDVRSLYHLGISGRVVLKHVEPLVDIYYDEQRGLVVIDPHVFVKTLREHFEEYAERLRNPLETELRTRFEKAFNTHHKIKQRAP